MDNLREHVKHISCAWQMDNVWVINAWLIADIIFVIHNINNVQIIRNDVEKQRLEGKST